MAVTDLHELADAIDEAIRSTTRPMLLQAARGLANEAGLASAAAAVKDGPDLIRDAMASVRDARQKERSVRDAYDAALAEAEDDLAGRFVTEANKTFLVTEDGEKRSMTADERRSWVAREARKAEAVRFAEKALHNAELDVAMASDDLTTAKDRFSAAKALQAGAVAYLNALSPALRSFDE